MKTYSMRTLVAALAVALIVPAAASCSSDGGSSDGGDPQQDTTGGLSDTGNGGGGDGVVINEVMVRASDDGPDWIELYNAGDEAVDLGGHMLSDNAEDLANAWTFPAGTQLAPGAFLVLEEATADGEGLLPFAFGSGEEAALLASDGTLIDLLDWDKDEVPRDATYGRYPDGSATVRVLWEPTPGSANMPGEEPPPGEDIVVSQDLQADPESPVIITELVAATSDDTPDWVELYNRSDDAVLLQGWGLSDDFETPFDFVFPDAIEVAAGEYFVIEGKNSDSALHFTFGLGSDDVLILTAPDGVTADWTEWTDGDAPADSSWALVDGTWQTVTPPTRGAANVE